jgi:hypothetical protein
MWNFTTNCATSNAVILESNPDFLGAASSYAGNSNVLMLSSLQVACGIPQLLTGNVASTSGGQTVSAYQWVEDGVVTVRRSVGPLDSFKLILNGQDRFKAQPGKFFNQMQPMMHHSGNPYPGVYCYSFALKPEELQPTGTCNFSRIDNSQVEITLKTGAQENQTLAMFAVNYNVLRIQSGMGGLAFSN